MSTEHQSALLTEYNDCSSKIGRLDSLIWQSASVLFPITLAGLGYFGLSTDHTHDQFFSLLAVAIGSITLVMTWLLLSRNWYFYQLISFYRLREIEAELGLWHYRYTLFLRKSEDSREKMLESMKKRDRERFQKLAEQRKDIPRLGLRRTMNFLTTLFITGWLVLIIREYVLTF